MAPYAYCVGPPRVKPLQPQLDAELGKKFWISCVATNDQDASINLIFTWRTPNGVQFNITTTDENDSRTATSTLHISEVTRNHGGVYRCTVSNGGPGSATTSSEIVVQGIAIILVNPLYHELVICLVHPSRPREVKIISKDINSLTVVWSKPAHTHGPVDHFKVNTLMFKRDVYLLLMVIINSCITPKLTIWIKN